MEKKQFSLIIGSSIVAIDVIDFLDKIVEAEYDEKSDSYIINAAEVIHL